MGVYTKSTCPNCKVVLSNWHRKDFMFGDPFARCANCGVRLKMNDVNEWEALSPFKKAHLYIGHCLIGIIPAAFLTSIILMIFDGNYKSGILYHNNILTPLGITITIFVSILAFIWRHNSFQQIISESKERTKNSDYRKRLGIE